jgi:hypothetical protein
MDGMNATLLDTQIEELRALLRTRLSIRGKTLPAQIRKAGRLLPRAVRRDATFLAEAQAMMQNPKLARMVDPAKLDLAHKSVVTFLESVDPKERRKDRLLGLLGYLALNFLLFGAAFITWLVWTERV